MYFAATIQFIAVCVSFSGTMYSCFLTRDRSFGRVILFSHHSYPKGGALDYILIFPSMTCSKSRVSAIIKVGSVVMLCYVMFFCLILQGITTYEYVVAMRTQSEPPGPSVEGGDQQSLPSSPTSSAVTAISGRSSVGMGLQYKGAWCTPPRYLWIIR